MKNNSPFNPEQTTALKQLRLRWLVALLTNAPLPFIALPVTGSDWLEQRPDGAATQAMMFALVVGVASLFIGLFVRNQAYKAHWRGEVVEPAGYLKGNTLFFLAVNTGAAAMFLISVVTGYPAPTFAAAPVFIALLVLNFPNGKPMKPAPPRIGTDGESL